MRQAGVASPIGVSLPLPGAVAFLLGSVFRPNFSLQRTRLIRSIQDYVSWMGYCYFLVHR